MIRWALVMVGVTGALVLAARGFIRPVRESWSIVGATGDGSVALFRWNYGNTGLFVDEITTRLVVVPPQGRGLELRAVRGAGQVQEGSIVAGPERVVWRPGRVEADVGGEAVQLRATLRGAEVDCPPKSGSMKGIVEFAPDGITLDGDGVLVHRRVVGRRDGFTLYVVTPTLSLGIDPGADCPAWLRSGRETWTGAAPAWEADEGLWRTQLGTAAVSVRLTGNGTVIEPTEGLLRGEHWLLWAAGQAAPWQVVRRAMVRINDGVAIPGLFIETDHGLTAPDRVRPEGWREKDAASPPSAPASGEPPGPGPG